MGKLPWFKFNVYDWLSSETVMLLSWAQRGIYMQLLAHSWVDNGCSIPKDIELVKKLCPKAKTKDVCVVLAKCFESEGVEVSRLKNDRLRSTYSEALVKSEKARASRNIGIIKQRNKTNVERTLNACIIKRSIDVDVDVEVDKEKEESKDRGKIKNRFSPPTLEEVTAYCLDRKTTVDPNTFVSFYESKGWMIGKNKMKSWKSAIHTWEAKENGKSNKSFHERDVEEATRVRKAARSFFGVHRGGVGLDDKQDKIKVDRGTEDSALDGVVCLSTVEDSKT